MFNRLTLGFSYLLALVIMTAGCGGPLDQEPPRSLPGTTTTVIMVRHAERDEGLDPPLNDEGIVRAQALAEVLEVNGVTAIYCPDLLRNRQTCEAVSDRLGVPVTLIETLRLADTRTLANDLAEEFVRDHSGGVVLFVGNTGPVVGDLSGNLQELYDRLGGDNDPPIRYRDLYVIVIPEEGDPHIVKATYGGASTLD